jgi:hypothetical protein
MKRLINLTPAEKDFSTMLLPPLRERQARS